MLDEEKLRATVNHIIMHLVQQDYRAVEQLSHGIRLSASELEAAIQRYGGTLVPLSHTAWHEFDVVEVDNTDPQEWSIDINLHTHEEGRSDLTLQLTIRDTPARFYHVELDDLHAL